MVDIIKNYEFQLKTQLTRATYYAKLGKIARCQFNNNSNKILGH